MKDASSAGPRRMCVICRGRFDKMELTRFIKDSEGMPIKDIKRRLPGRGFYCCSDPRCLAKIAFYRPKVGTAGKRGPAVKG